MFRQNISNVWIVISLLMLSFWAEPVFAARYGGGYRQYRPVRQYRTPTRPMPKPARPMQPRPLPKYVPKPLPHRPTPRVFNPVQVKPLQVKPGQKNPAANYQQTQDTRHNADGRVNQQQTKAERSARETKATDPAAKAKTEAMFSNLTRDAVKEKSTRGPSKNYTKKGGYQQAKGDFEALQLTGIKETSGGRVGILPDGRNAILRPATKEKPATVEIQGPGPNREKIRYFD